jgi:hypothetical protein
MAGSYSYPTRSSYKATTSQPYRISAIYSTDQHVAKFNDLLFLAWGRVWGRLTISTYRRQLLSNEKEAETSIIAFFMFEWLAIT